MRLYFKPQIATVAIQQNQDSQSNTIRSQMQLDYASRNQVVRNRYEHPLHSNCYSMYNTAAFKRYVTSKKILKNLLKVWTSP